VKKPTFEQIEDAFRSGEDLGFCRYCGAEAFCVEPDARGLTCEICGEDAVYGYEELLVMKEFT